jgi:hypothetical protein
MAQAVECLFCKLKTLSANPSPGRKEGFISSFLFNY